MGNFVARTEPDVPFIPPGFGFLSNTAARLWTVTGSGVALTLFDRRQKIGGMTHFCRPYREAGAESTAMYAAPAIVSLLALFREAGSRPGDIEAQIYGGGSNSMQENHDPEIGKKNVQVAREILKRQKVAVTGFDTGGARGRRIGFNTQTGESVVFRVNEIRSRDWYPLPDTVN